MWLQKPEQSEKAVCFWTYIFDDRKEGEVGARAKLKKT